mmetsp:Transcript_4736/g.7058  ORF Transcript_4736/g.7058 Transcript_4736/m.7058 type:complete len:209 (+) Transcript_4736:75-701(+)
MATFTEASKPQNHSKIWRHGRKDLDVMNVLFENELSSLTKAGHSKHYILHYMNIYKKGVMDMRKELVDIITEELIPENEKIGTDPDHWFEINLANCVLFPNLTLEGIGELLPGRLFTTRMPRDIITSPLAAEKFRQKKLFFNLDTALVLTGLISFTLFYLLFQLTSHSQSLSLRNRGVCKVCWCRFRRILFFDWHQNYSSTHHRLQCS